MIFSIIGAFFVYIMGAFYVTKIIYVFIKVGSIPSLKDLTIELLLALDLFLFGSLLLIFAYGTYDLFIRSAFPETLQSSAKQCPIWLSIGTMEDLKGYLLGYIIIMLSVTFLQKAVALEYTSPVSLFLFAGGIFLLGLTYYFVHKR